MTCPYRTGICGITRRGFVLGAGVGLATGAAAAVGVARHWPAWPRPTQPPVLMADAMPGPFPGRVVEVHDASAVATDWSISADAVRGMVQRGMDELTGGDGPSAWQRFFESGDVVAIKVNPVGRRYRAGQASSISSHELVVSVVEGLKCAGVKPRDIILCERYADQFRGAGYEALLREQPLEGVRWHAASARYTDSQLDIEGYDARRDLDPHVVGYDRDAFVHMGYANPFDDARDDRRTRSHLSVVATRMANKIINLPVLKDHGSAGVTLALKNLSHGMFNNVSRSHLPRAYRTAGPSGPNQCNTFIPTVLSRPEIKQKCVLHILDGLVGVWQGGPSSTSGCIWARQSLFFATDPVALDLIGWEIVDAKRVEQGLLPVGEAGLQANRGARQEAFDRRQPEHILLAGTLGLGRADRAGLDYRRIALRG
ncbi:MAG: DUF362 domain-containing protein [Planctomycetia bacterium]|nr:DUF362 domain-containing protein [Planctomycetia bacterium]